MKPALYYAIRKGCDHSIVAVTTEKAGRFGRRRWHGRYVIDNTPTHGNSGDLRGYFKTQEDAEKCIARIKEIDAKYDKKNKRVSGILTKLYRDREAEIRNVCDAW